VKEAKALLEAQKDSLKQAELSASAEVWTDFYQYNTAVKKLEFSRSFLQSAQEAYDLALEGYDVGVKNILDLLSAQSQLSDARSKVVSAERDLFAALVELSHSMGAMYLDKEKIIRAVQ
jgi:outer membrane protein TolC